MVDILLDRVAKNAASRLHRYSSTGQVDPGWKGIKEEKPDEDVDFNRNESGPFAINEGRGARVSLELEIRLQLLHRE